MVEPVTTNRRLIVPNTGDLSGAWGTSALNPNFQMIDASFGGVTTISLSSATTITLSAPATTGVPGAVPQASNALIRFTGTQSGDAVIIFPIPGYYVIENLTTASTNDIVLLTPIAGSDFIGAPRGMKVQVFYDGTQGLAYVGLGVPGSAFDLHGETSVPRWISQSSPKPYLLKDGTSYSTATYPYLAWALRNFPGNSNPPGASFFVPDERARARIGYDAGATGRLTSAVSGVDGGTMGSAGGDQRLQAHTHSNTLSDPGHLHVGDSTNGGTTVNAAFGATYVFNVGGNTGTATTGVSITNANVGTGTTQNVQPSIVSFLPLIKT